MASRRPDPPGNLQQLAAMLSVQSLDLRAEYEAKLRILTSIQREIEVLRSAISSASQQQRALGELRQRFDELTSANRDASDALNMIRTAFDRVEEQETTPDPREAGL